MTELVLISGAEVVTQARTWLGTNYMHQHRVKGYGVDCVGLPIGVCRDLGVVEPDFDVTGYARNPDGRTLLATADKYMTRVPMYQLALGHVIVFAFEQHPQHMGIIADYKHGGLSVIQALANSNGKGKVIEWRLTQRRGWTPVQAYALPGVTYEVTEP